MEFEALLIFGIISFLSAQLYYRPTRYFLRKFASYDCMDHYQGQDYIQNNDQVILLGYQNGFVRTVVLQGCLLYCDFTKWKNTPALLKNWGWQTLLVKFTLWAKRQNWDFYILVNEKENKFPLIFLVMKFQIYINP